MLSHPSVHYCHLQTLQCECRRGICTHEAEAAVIRMKHTKSLTLLLVFNLMNNHSYQKFESLLILANIPQLAPCFLLQALSQELPFHAAPPGTSCLCVLVELPSFVPALPPQKATQRQTILRAREAAVNSSTVLGLRP